MTIKSCPKMKTSPFGFASTPKPTELEDGFTPAKLKLENLVQDVVKKPWAVNDSSDDDGDDSFDDYDDGDGDGNDSFDDSVELSVVNQAIWQQEHFDVPMPGVAGGMLSVPYDMSGMPLRDAAVGQPVSIPDLATALASATPVQQRTMLGESLYPLVDLLEHEMAAKVTGMLLEMDQIEVLRLLESPEALKVKVGEAMYVLRNVDSVEEANSATDQLSSLSLNEEINQEIGQQEHLDDAGYGNDNEIDLNT